MRGVYSSAAKSRLRSVISLLSGVALAFGFLAFTGAPELALAYEVPTGTWSTPANNSSIITFPSGLTATVSSGGRTDVTGVSTLGAKEWASGIYSPSTMVTGDSGVAFLVNTGTCAATGTCTGLGTLTVTFNHPVRNPTFDFAGIGGTSGGSSWSALHAVLTSTTSGVTLSQASGNSQFSVASNQITATDNRTSSTCVTAGSTGYTASCGSVVANGTSSAFSFDVSAIFTAMSGRGSNSSTTGDEIILAISVPQDFGDAPSGYDQTQAAAHVISGLYLGSAATEDNASVRNATTSPNAGAGASADSDDAFAGLPDIAAQPGLEYSLSVPISGVTASSTVCGWLDFNRNTVFDTSAASGEQSCATVAAGATKADLTWTVPSGVSAGSSYARFRISNTAAEITGKPTGRATTGEVEDYPVSIAAMPTITVRKTTTAGSGGAFGFTLTNTTQTSGTVTTLAADTPTQVDGDTATAGDQPFTASAINTAVTIQESQSPAGWAFATASCTSGGATVGSLSGTTMTLPATAIVPGADIVCDYTNGQPGISLTKTAGSLSGMTAGSTLPYTFTVTNTGQTSLSSITITDSKIATVTCDATALAIGAATTCSGTYTLKQADVDAGQVINNASVSATPPTGPAVDATATSTKTITSAAAISLTKTAGSLSGNSAGSTLPYTFTVTNTGNVTLADITITDPQVSGLTCTATTLAPQGSTTCSASHTVTQDEVDAGSIVNNATVSGAPPSGPAVTDTATSTTAVARSTSIALTKTAGTPTGMTATATIPYTFTVTNTGNVTLTGVSITDAQTSGVTCTNTTVAPNASTECSGSHVITQAELDSGTVTNHASVTAAPPTGMSAPTDSATATSTLTRTAQATLDKQFAGTSGWSVGDVMSYSFVVTNTGNVTLSDISVDDPLTTAMDCPITTLAPTASTTCTAQHTLTQAEVDAGHLYNSATLSATPPAGLSAVSVTDDLDTAITTGPALTLAKTASAPSVTAKDGRIDYSFLVTNTGNVTVTEVAITDAGATNLACPETTLAPQQSTTCTGEHLLTQDEVDTGSVTNTATVDALSPTSDHVTATDSVTTALSRTSSLLLDKQAGTPTAAVPGATIAYTFAVKNTGNVTVTGVTINDSQLTSLSCPTTPLAPGVTMNCTGSYTLTQSDVDAGGVPNSATATATPPTGVAVPTSNQDATVTAIDRTASLDFTKTAGAPTGDAEGKTITYTFEVTNTGNVTLSEVGVDDPLVGPVVCPSSDLAPNASMTCTAVYPITQADVDAGAVHNTATASGTAPAGVTSPSAAASADSTLTRTAAMTLVKRTAGTVPTTADSDLSYEFVVTNTGNVTLSNVTVDDPKIGLVSCPDDDLAPGNTMTCTGSYTLQQSDVDAGAVANSASATATPPTGVTTTPTAADTITTDIPASPSIELLKSAGPVVDANSSSREDAGDAITYTFTVTNTGNVTLTTVGVDDPQVGPVSCPVASLAPGAHTTCSKVYTLLQSDLDAGAVVNNATASGTPPTGVAVTDAATATTSLTRSAGLAFDKQAGTPSGSQVGSTITYTFVLTNTGNVTLTDIGVTDPKIAPVSCPVDTLQPGASTSCTKLYSITQDDLNTGSVANTATGHGTAPAGVTSPSTDDSTTTSLAQNPEVSLDKQAGAIADANGTGQLDAGDTITYTFEASNTGNVTLDPVTIHDPLLFSSDVDCGAITPGTTKLCATAAYTLTQADIDAGHVVNNATASGLAPDGTTSSPQATDSTDTSVAGASAITLTKSASAVADTNGTGRTDAGDTISYTFEVTNTGSTTVDSVTISDPKATLNGCSLGSLAPGGTATCTGTHVLTLDDLNAGILTNTATVTGTAANGPAVTDTASAESTIAQTPSLSIVKQATTPDSDLGGVNDAIDYTFTVTNTGTVTVTGVGVTDPIIETVSCPVMSLDPGEATTCTGSYALTQSDVDAGSVVNTATATGSAPDGSSLSADSDPVTSAIAAAPELSLTKAAGATTDVNGNGLVDLGDTVAYTFTATNTGNVTLSGITVNDSKVPSVTCPATPVLPEASLTCTGSHVLTQPEIDAGVVINTATATATPPSGPAVAATSNTVVATLPSQPSADLDKQAGSIVDANGNGRTDAGDTISYTFTVINTGNVTLNPVTITDAKAVLDSSCDTLAPLAPGASATCTGAHTLSQAEADSGASTNTATLTATPPVGAAITATDSTATGITSAPGLTLDKTVSSFTDPDSDGLTVGDTIHYSFTVANSGNVTLDPVVITDAAAELDASCDTVGPLLPDATASCTGEHVLSQSDVDSGHYANSATVVGTTPTGTETSAGDSTDTTIAAQPGISIVKAAGSPSGTTAGSTIPYTFTVTNTGTVTLTGIAVTDAKITTGINCPGDTLAPHDSLSCTAAYPLTQDDIDSGTVVNTASVTGNPPAGDPVTDDSDPVTSTIDAEPMLSIVKSASDPSDNIAGATIDYTFTVTNTGNVTVTNLSVTDPLITTVSCLADSLAPAAATTCTGSHVLSQAELDAGAVLNTATAHGTSPQGTQISQDSNQVRTDLPANPSLSVEKSAGAPSGNSAGDTIVYSFTVTNTGNVTITGIRIEDPRIADISCADATVAPAVATTCTGSYTLTQADIDNGAVTNTATAAGTSPTGDPVSGTSNTVTTDIVATPGIDLVKTGSAVGQHAGDTVDYDFTVTNTGNVTVTALVISDPLISSISCPQTVLAPAVETVCTGSYTLTQADVDAGFVHNDAEASADTPHSGAVTSADGTDVFIAAGPGLDLVKQAGTVVDVDGNGVEAGDVLPYTFTVTNSGNVTMSAVAIQDPKISNVSCPTDSLAPGETLSCTGDYTLSQADIDAGSVTNSAKATAVGPNPDVELPLHPAYASDSVTTPIDQHPALSLTKKSNAKGTVTVNSTVVFTFVVTNTGNVVLNDITVSDPMLKSVSCPVQTLQPGQSTLCTGSPYTVTAQDAAKGTLVNTAIASTGFCPAAGCSTVSARSTVRLPVARDTQLAYTGVEVTRSLMLGGAILLAGMVLVFAARRRRHND